MLYYFDPKKPKIIPYASHSTTVTVHFCFISVIWIFILRFSDLRPLDPLAETRLCVMNFERRP